MANARQFMAARTAAWAKSGGWKNPYVTDGLIAMWDGEWNTGVGGVHSNVTNIWKDIIGGVELKCKNASGSDVQSKWGDKFVDGRGEDFRFITDECREITKVIESNVFTVEIVAATQSNSQSRYTGSFSFSNYSNVSNYTYGFESFNGQYHVSCGKFAGAKNTIRWENGVIDIPYWISMSKNDSNLCYLKSIFNDQTTIRSVSQTSTSVSDKVGLMLCGTAGLGGYGTYGHCRVFNFRIYNRQLGDSEIMKNYDVDTVRFGLPVITSTP